MQRDGNRNNESRCRNRDVIDVVVTMKQAVDAKSRNTHIDFTMCTGSYFCFFVFIPYLVCLSNIMVFSKLFFS